MRQHSAQHIFRAGDGFALAGSEVYLGLEPALAGQSVDRIAGSTATYAVSQARHLAQWWPGPSPQGGRGLGSGLESAA